jgi:hypothetical protein
MIDARELNRMPEAEARALLAERDEDLERQAVELERLDRLEGYAPAPAWAARPPPKAP